MAAVVLHNTLGPVSEPCSGSRKGVALGVSGPGANEEARRDLTWLGMFRALMADL